MAAYEHSTNDGVKLSVHARAKKSALGNLKDVMDSLEQPKIAKPGESVVSVTRKSASPKPSEDFKGGNGKVLPHAKTLDQHEKVETPDMEAGESPDIEHQEQEEGLDGEENYHSTRSEPTNTIPKHEKSSEHKSLGSPDKVDAALKHFMVKSKKHHKY